MIQSVNSVLVSDMTSSKNEIITIENHPDFIGFQVVLTLPNGQQYVVIAKDLVAAVTNAANNGYFSSNMASEFQATLKQP